MGSLGSRAWWTVPAHFLSPLEFYLEEGQEERIFAPGDADLRHIEVHSHTLIQLEPWVTATGQTRVTVVGPLGARQWLRDMMSSVGSQDPHRQARGLEMLQLVRRQPLSKDDLATAMLSDTGDLTLRARLRRASRSRVLGFPCAIILAVLESFELLVS